MVIVLGAGMLADAQTVIGNEKMFHDADSVTVTFDLDTDNTDLPVRRKEVILPYIYNVGSGRRFWHWFWQWLCLCPWLLPLVLRSTIRARS